MRLYGADRKMYHNGPFAPGTGETFELFKNDSESGCTTYVLNSPFKGMLLKVVIADPANREFCAY